MSSDRPNRRDGGSGRVLGASLASGTGLLSARGEARDSELGEQLSGFGRGGGERRSRRDAWAAAQVAAARDDPAARLALMERLFRGPTGRAPRHLPFRRAALSFMLWQAERGLLDPLDASPAGSVWWRAMNERLLCDGCEAIALLRGFPALRRHTAYSCGFSSRRPRHRPGGTRPITRASSPATCSTKVRRTRRTRPSGSS